MSNIDKNEQRAQLGLQTYILRFYFIFTSSPKGLKFGTKIGLQTYTLKKDLMKNMTMSKQARKIDDENFRKTP